MIMKVGDRVRVRVHTLNYDTIREAEIVHIKGCRVTVTFDNGMSICTHESNITSIVNNVGN